MMGQDKFGCEIRRATRRPIDVKEWLDARYEGEMKDNSGVGQVLFCVSTFNNHEFLRKSKVGGPVAMAWHVFVLCLEATDML
jgi:hypothetical protein